MVFLYSGAQDVARQIVADLVSERAAGEPATRGSRGRKTEKIE